MRCRDRPEGHVAAAQRAGENIREEELLLEEPQPHTSSSEERRGGFKLSRDHRQRDGGVGGRGGKKRKC